MFMQKIRFLQLLYCLKITSKISIKIFKIINCGKIIGVRKAIFSVKIYITLGYIYIKIYGLLPWRQMAAILDLPLWIPPVKFWGIPRLNFSFNIYRCHFNNKTDSCTPRSRNWRFWPIYMITIWCTYVFDTSWTIPI